MVMFRIYLVVVLACLTGYTLVVGAYHGWSLFPIFFSNIAEMSWSGQFNLDFMTFLGLSGVWVAWRHQFTGARGGVRSQGAVFKSGVDRAAQVTRDLQARP